MKVNNQNIIKIELTNEEAVKRLTVEIDHNLSLEVRQLAKSIH